MRKDTLDNLRDAVAEVLRVYGACHGVIPEPYQQPMTELREAYRLAFIFNHLHELTPAQEAEALVREYNSLKSYDKLDEDALADKRDDELRRAD